MVLIECKEEYKLKTSYQTWHVISTYVINNTGCYLNPNPFIQGTEQNQPANANEWWKNKMPSIQPKTQEKMAVTIQKKHKPSTTEYCTFHAYFTLILHKRYNELFMSFHCCSKYKLLFSQVVAKYTPYHILLHDMVLFHGNSIKIHVLIVTEFGIWKYYKLHYCVFSGCLLWLLLSHCIITWVHLLSFLQFSVIIIATCCVHLQDIIQT